MTIRFKQNGSMVNASFARYRVAGAWVNAAFVRVREAGVWVNKLLAFSVTATPASALGDVSNFGGPPSAPVQSNSVTVSATGGWTPHTFNGWSSVSNPGAVVISNAASLTPFFSNAAVLSGTPATAVFRAQFTDQSGATAFTDVSVELLYSNGTIA